MQGIQDFSTNFPVGWTLHRLLENGLLQQPTPTCSPTKSHRFSSSWNMSVSRKCERLLGIFDNGFFWQLIFMFRFENGDSILAPGGSVSNMYALMIARHKAFPQHKKYGMRAIKGQLIMYTSQHVNSFVFESANPNLVLISASLL